jgi:hypothetical protein
MSKFAELREVLFEHNDKTLRCSRVGAVWAGWITFAGAGELFFGAPSVVTPLGK